MYKFREFLLLAVKAGCVRTFKLMFAEKIVGSRTFNDYRGSLLVRKRNPLGPYRRPMHRVLGGSQGGGCFLMSEETLQGPYMYLNFGRGPYCETF